MGPQSGIILCLDPPTPPTPPTHPPACLPRRDEQIIEHQRETARQADDDEGISQQQPAATDTPPKKKKKGKGKPLMAASTFNAIRF